ncbi:MAG: DUF559 domain-containing protein [Anaerolineales bacterium]|nr:DUF559 domain-containing protein [Anaerolineales bacterium]
MTFNLRHCTIMEDERWEKVLSAVGLRVLRFRNDDVMKNLFTVVGRFREAIQKPEKQV